ncbi:hypothetical protein H0H87_010077, partial [Tephrocybe sp. NHM501043]
MANSDVIRAGLTPKLRDIPQPHRNAHVHLLACIPAARLAVYLPLLFCCFFTSYTQDPEHEHAIRTFILEFSVVQTKLPQEGEETHHAIEGPSI